MAMSQTHDRKETILVVDDDASLSGLLQRYLTENGYHVAMAADGRSMDDYLRGGTVDLVILDLMLPGEDGLAIARRLRAAGKQPIIICSAKGDDVDRILGLELGADDYLSKPFNPRELLARIRAVLRRAAGREGEVVQAFGPFRLNLESHALLRDGEEVSLTAGEFALLRVFAEHPNRVLSRDLLVELIKGYERGAFDRSIDVRVTRLRRKIESDPESPVYIRTVWGSGYLFAPAGSSAG
jgi:DNA-binding response OmpR family regulator